MKYWKLLFLLVLFILLILFYLQKDNEVKVEIYQAFHKEAPILQNEIMIPMHVGRALNKKEGLPLVNKMIGDNTGDNISEKNERYAELTAIYWMWKNSKADVVGLMHYRRSLILPTEEKECDNHLCNIGLTKENVKRLMKDYDVIHVKHCNLYYSIYNNYLERHVARDMHLAIEYIYNKYPKMRGALNRALYNTFFSSTNMFIMKKDVLDEYATWLFDVLFGIEDKLSNYNGYQKRTPGFLAERLFTVWVEANKHKYKFLGVDLEVR